MWITFLSMATCNLVVKRFESGRKWYIGSVYEMFYNRGLGRDSGPKLEEQYTISFTNTGDSLFDALNNILPVKFWGAVIYEMVDKSSYPHAIPFCFWERTTTDAPTMEDCVDQFRTYQTQKSFIEQYEQNNLSFILWDTRTSGSEEPGVHIPQDNIYSGVAYTLYAERYGQSGDRHLTPSYQKWQEEMEKVHTDQTHKSKRSVKKMNVSELLLELKTLW